MSARVRGTVACLAVAGVLAGGAGAYAATGGSKTKPPANAHATHTMNGTKSSANCPNM
jgi:hypothetical protein